MIRTLIAGALAALIAIPAAAGSDFSEGSQIKGWKNLEGREPAVFRAKVVDVLCELTGECAEKCGAGKRQMGLIREADGKLIFVLKNSQASFNGAAVDLAPYCGKTVTVDGLLVANPDLTSTKIYQVHMIQREGSDKWAKTKRWTRMWKRDNKALARKSGPWFRKDAGIVAEVEAHGWLGLGAEEDEKFIEENY